MGMFDYIHGKIQCPKCGNDIEIYEQIKWANRILEDYHVGDEIEATDGIYDWATFGSPELKEKCKCCGKTVHYEVEVKNGIVVDIRTKEK